MLLELSDTAKPSLEKNLATGTKGVYIDIKSKYLDKGLYAEKMQLRFLLRLMEFST
jgi:hypothetical protein